MTVQPGLCWTWSEPKLLVFSRTGSFLSRVVIYLPFLTGIPPPGDLFALGSRPGSDSSDKKLALGKRESTSLLTPAAAMKKPKLVSQAQTFTPLGRPAERDTERRVSPVPTVSNLFEESAIDGRFLYQMC